MSAIGAGIAASATRQRVVAVIAVQRVRTLAAVDDVVAASAAEGVVAAEAVDQVRRGVAGDGVGRVGRGAERQPAAAAARMKSVTSMSAFVTPLIWIVPMIAEAGVPDREEGVGAALVVLDDAGGEVRRRDAKAAQVDQVLGRSVPPAASKLLMMSSPKPMAL